MAFDPENSKHISQLDESIKYADDKLNKFREQMVQHVKQLAGSQYGEEACDDNTPIPLMSLAHRIYRRFIGTREPRAVVATRFRELLPQAATLELALNHQLEKMNLGEALTKCGSQALFRMGTMEVGVDEDGETFADDILFEDRILDMRGRTAREMRWSGHRFRMSLEEAKNNPRFDPKVRKELEVYDEEDDVDNGKSKESKSNQVSIGNGLHKEGIEPEVELTQIWIPSQRMILIMGPSHGPDGGMKKPLRVIENWKGPEWGPYIDLGFGYIPGNLMPQGVLPSIYEMHLIANKLFNKAAIQADRQKTNMLVKNSAKDEAETVAEAGDGRQIFTDDPDAFKEVRTGGADQQTLAMVMWTKQMAMLLGGNLDALGGLSAQTSTVGQDRLLNDSANETVADIQLDTQLFAKRVIGSIAWHLWNDPLVDIQVFKQIGRSGITVPARFNRESRTGEFFQYDFQIDPYSLKPKSPQERSAIAESFLMKIVMPLMPQMQQAGMSIDWEYLMKMFARYSNTPELDHMILYTGGESIAPETPEGSSMPASTTRKYIRENRSGATRNGQEQAMIASMMSGGSKNPEMASLGKPTE